MKVRSITLEGENGLTATISREQPAKGPENIFCQINDAQGTPVTIHWTALDDATDQRRMAECIQNRLDGCRGTNSMINDYYREIQRFAN